MSDDIDIRLLALNIPKLEEIYKLSIQQQQVRGFFTHLHNYLEVIRDNPKLNELVWTLVIENYNQNNPKHKFKGDIKKLAEGLTVGNEYQSYLENALDAHKGVTRAYYCWFFLFSAFDLFDMNPDTDNLTMQETILKDLSEGTKALLQEDDSEYRNIFLKNDDSKNKRFRRSDYQLYLEVFHAQLLSWYSKLSQQQSPEDTKSLSRRLPEVLIDIGNGFKVHKGNIVSYEDKEIPMELQVRKIVAIIMERSKTDTFTPTAYLSECALDNSRDYEQPEKYVIKIVSEARTVFKSATNSNHNYFPNKRDSGYIFQP